MEINISMKMELITFILLLITSICLADEYRQSSNYQPYRVPNLEKWKAYFEESQSQKNLPKLPHKYFQAGERNPHSNIIFEPDEGISFEEYFPLDDELESSLPYGIQNVRDLSERQLATHDKIELPEQEGTVRKTTFQSLCPVVRRTVFLNMTGFEYRPDHYEEVLCIHGYTNIQEYSPAQNKVCSQAGFSCIQLSRTIYLTRRASATDCWESESRKVFAGCECMWPRHHFGDIGVHH